MSQVLNWILANPAQFASLVATLIVIVVATMAAWHAGGFRKGLLVLMLRAADARRKGLLGPIDGPEVADLVVQWAILLLVPRLPAFMRPAFTPDHIRKALQDSWDLSLDYLDDGVLNGTHPTLSSVAKAAAGRQPPAAR